MGGLLAVQLKGDHAAEAGGLAQVDGIARVVLKAHVVDLLHLGVAAQPAGHRLCVLVVPGHPQGQGLQPPEDQPGVEGGQAVAPGLHLPTEVGGQLGGLDHGDAGDDVVVAAQILGAAVDHDVGPQGEGPLEIGGQEGVVYHQEGAAAVGDLGDLPDVGHLHHGVGGGLDEEHTGGGPDGLAHGRQIGHLHIGEGAAQLAEDLVADAEGAAVDVVREDHMVPRLEQAEQAHVGRLAAGKGEGLGPLLQDGHGALQLLPGGVLKPGVVVAGGDAEPPVAEGGGLEDGEAHRPGDGVAAQGPVDHLGVEVQVLLPVEVLIIVLVDHAGSSSYVLAGI